MFRFHKTLDVITLFHKATSPASIRVQSFLKQASANAAEYATEDQASDHSHQTTPRRTEFELEVTEEPPTPEQLTSILEYLGGSKPSTVIKGARDEADALKKLKENSDNVQRPITVDWSNGKAVVGDQESEILKMFSDLHEFFDGVDLWTEGAGFLLLVLHEMHRQNEKNKKDKEAAQAVIERVKAKKAEVERAKVIEAEIVRSTELRLEIQKRDEINRWAGLWVYDHKEAVVNSFASQDLMTLFDDIDLQNIEGMREDELLILRGALDNQRSALKARFPARSRITSQARKPQIDLIHHPSALLLENELSYRPSVPEFERESLLVHRVLGSAVPIQHPQPMRYHSDTYRDQVIAHRKPSQIQPLQNQPPQPYPPHVQNYHAFMENQRHQANSNNSPPSYVEHRTANLVPQGHSSLEWSNNVTTREQRPHIQPNKLQNQTRSNSNTQFNASSRVTTFGVAPHGHAPVNQLTNNGPIYVHNSQRVSPQFSPHPVRNQTAEGHLGSSLPRLYSEPSKDHGFSNDARLYDYTEGQRGYRSTNPSTSSNFFRGEFKRYLQAGNPNSWHDRTIWVGGITREIYDEEILKELMSELGDIEMVRYLPSKHQESAFVTFVNAGTRECAIQKYHMNECILRNRSLTVDYPRDSIARKRSGSGSSQSSFTGHGTYHHRSAGRLGGQKQYNRAVLQSAMQSPIPHSPVPSHAGFEPQHTQNGSPIATSRGHNFDNVQTSPSSLIAPEKNQDQIVANANGRSMVSSSVNSYSNMAKNSSDNVRQGSKINTGPFNKTGPRTGGSKHRDSTLNNKKENIPIAKTPRYQTPISTPRQGTPISEVPNAPSGDKRSKAGGKNKKKAKQNISARPTSVAPTPVAGPTPAGPSPTVTPVKDCNNNIVANIDHLLTDLSPARSMKIETMGRQKSLDEGVDIIGPANVLSKVDTAPETTRNSASLPVHKNALDSSLEGTSQGTERKTKVKHKGIKSSRKYLNSQEAQTTAAKGNSSTGHPISPTKTDEYLSAHSRNTSFSTAPSRKPSVASGVPDIPFPSKAGDLQNEKTTSSCSSITQYDVSSKSNKKSKAGSLDSQKIQGNYQENERQTHIKKESTTSAASSSSTRKADLKGTKTTENAKPNGAAQGSKTQDLKKAKSKEDKKTPEGKRDKQCSPVSVDLLEDKSQWPALAPANSPQAKIADGKHPPPISPAFKRKESENPTLPATPQNQLGSMS
ncbi:hypothetical protein B7494_g6153 [Chlorociboria aeruginascens]|nr:hypothetical protein B7494_g6153 [Chlorociboria aeruginascens]